MENIAGEQDLLASNLFLYKSLYILKKIQIPIKIHTLMSGASNLAILLLTARSFYFWYPFCATTIFYD